MNRNENKLLEILNEISNYKLLYEILIFVLEFDYESRDIEIIK